ncbi:hypothetical protein LARI1_G008072 [Lachnellula arida]|uniref:Post-SET domain-containing protein n=1 Tax=Lachnellula arida TaxID=1316785 RepID=A0A8T9B199_9HELO|nr:hypothetical protein LARI1_G008072 [Lachnellula arida]
MYPSIAEVLPRTRQSVSVPAYTRSISLPPSNRQTQTFIYSPSLSAVTPSLHTYISPTQLKQKENKHHQATKPKPVNTQPTPPYKKTKNASPNPLLVPTSHPDIQSVQFSTEKDFTTKSFSTIALPPFGFFAKLSFPPCTLADSATYATVQIGRETHMNLNSDLVYINHSCVPSVIFDTTSLSILAGPHGLQPNQELTFFYPSTEWDMAQGFSCFCGADTCRGYIGGAKQMGRGALEGVWLNAHIRELLEERERGCGDGAVDGQRAVDIPAQETNGNEKEKKNGDEIGNMNMNAKVNTNTNPKKDFDAMETALLASLQQAEMLVEAAKHALSTYVGQYGKLAQKGGVRENGVGSRELSGEMGGDTDELGVAGKRRGVTSREMSGEMGGDTVS